jgi:hypothetical protein
LAFRHLPHLPYLPYLSIALLPLLAVCGGDAPDDDAAPDPPASAPEAAAPASDGPDVWLSELSLGDEGLVSLGEPRNLTRRPGYDDQPHFLSDGDLFYTRQEAGRTDIWRWDRDADAVAPVTRTDPESEYSPTPLPGGTGFSVVRVEADSTQRLWRFDDDGAGAAVLLPDVAPVGYHAWVSPDTVALFVLGDPPTLQLASVRTGEARILAEDIGRSLQRVPGEHAFSFVQRHAEGGTTIRVYDVARDTVSDAGAGVDGGDFHAWTPSGTLLQAAGGRLFFWHSAMGHWMPAADFTDRGLVLSRLAVSPDGGWLAFVAEGGAEPEVDQPEADQPDADDSGDDR